MFRKNELTADIIILTSKPVVIVLKNDESFEAKLDAINDCVTNLGREENFVAKPARLKYCEMFFKVM